MVQVRALTVSACRIGSAHIGWRHRAAHAAGPGDLRFVVGWLRACSLATPLAQTCPWAVSIDARFSDVMPYRKRSLAERRVALDEQAQELGLGY